MKVHVSTSHYEFSHGKQPRGYGYWMFGEWTGSDYDVRIGVSGTYSAAKREAVKIARSMAEGSPVDEITLVVMP